jgi:hypothetical protein
MIGPNKSGSPLKRVSTGTEISVRRLKRKMLRHALVPQELSHNGSYSLQRILSSSESKLKKALV